MVIICGVFGICYGPAGPEGEGWSPEDLMQLMFPAIEHRGPHAWGYMVHHAGADEVDYFRTPGSCKEPGAMEQMSIAPDAPPVDWLVGHVRWATTGNPSVNSNNHPLESVNGVIGVHNGKLRGAWSSLLTKAGGRKDATATVDSEAIFTSVGKYGVKEGLSKVEGSMVSIFTLLSAPDTLYVARSHSRPLVYGFTEAGSFVFASEHATLAATGLVINNIVDWKAGNSVLTIRGGKVVERMQYAIPKPSDPRPASVGSLSGITDRLSVGPSDPTRYQYRSQPGKTATPSLMESLPRPLPDMMLKQKDDWGGTYVGGNIWLTPDGQALNANDYIKWAVSVEMAAANFTSAVDAAVEYNPNQQTSLS